jgi:ATP-dependent Clp protease ATP-binding subunit ClpA
MISKRAEGVLNRAVQLAIEEKHEYFTLEHVYLALLEEAEIVEALSACAGNVSFLREQLRDYLERSVPKLEVGPTGSEVERPTPTLAIERLIQRALFHVQASGKDEIQPMDLLVSLFQARDSMSLMLLKHQGIERLDLLNFISHGIRKDSEESQLPEISGSSESEFPEGKSDPRSSSGSAGGEAAQQQDPLKAYTVNLNELARKGKIDPLVGRVQELERMIQTLCRRRKNNPLLVGEAGVGKTALAEGLALRIVQEEVPDLLNQAVVYSLEMGTLLAGTKFRGDFEQRLKRVISALEKKADSGQKPILFIDEIHTIIGAGAVSGGALDAANLLKPLLTRGEIRCLGSTTYGEYRTVFEKDHALARRFQKIDVVEPTQEEAIQILTGLKSRFEEHHDVVYTPDAIRAVVELSAKHLTDRQLPDKAIDVLDEAGAKARLARAKAEVEAGESGEARTVIDRPQIEEIISQIARIPSRAVSVSQKDRLKNLDRDLKLAIFGQNSVIESVVTAIRLSRSGLRSGDKPVGSFLFCGPTGVGKTELSKQLAQSLGIPFLRFDMSEYMEKHTVSRLIGAPPGYVGFEQAGLLTDAVLKNPHSIVLLDEIEKAHSDLWNLLLQVMDHGSLTDNNGRKVDFRNVILLMTSNVGSREMEKRPLGMFSSEVQTMRSAASKEVERTFTPEFRNRLDAICYFEPLARETMVQVVSKQLVELETLLLAKGVDLDINDEVREYLSRKGYDRSMGARPLARVIQDELKKPLSAEILFGQLEKGGTARVRIKKGPGEEEQLAFDFGRKGEGRALPAPSSMSSREPADAES